MHSAGESEPSSAPSLLSPRTADHTGMSGPVRAKMGSALGGDFSDVAVHTESARAGELKALAFTQGSEIHVAPGHWAPDTTRGRKLLGHELGHVLQQRAGKVSATAPLGGAKFNDDATLEREADALGARAALTEGPRHLAATPAVRATPQPAAAAAGGVVQRLPAPEADPAHDPLLDEYSNDTGVPRNAASQHDPGYRAWLTFRGLDRLTVEELMAALSDIEARGGLNALIATSRFAIAFHYTRLVTAMQVVRQIRGAGANSATALATISASGLPADEQAAMSHYVRVPTARRPDQRIAIAPGGAAALPTADLAHELGYELDPSSRPAPAPKPKPVPPGSPPPPPPAPPPRIPWDGADGAVGAPAARAAMQAELFKAHDAYLKYVRPRVVAALTKPRVPFATPAAPAAGAAPKPTGVVDIANQARAVLEARYATSMDAAAPSAGVTAGRAPRTTAPGAQNIFDPTIEADRIALTGKADLAPDMAWWLFGNDRPGAAGAPGTRRFATEILAAHRYSTQDPGAEKFRWDVAKAYAAASTLVPNNRRHLIDFRMTVSEADPRPIAKGITVQSSFDPGAKPDRAELAARWSILGTATHESLHLRTHPAFEAADQGRDTMKEGFVEMFTIATLNSDILPRARAGSVEPLRRTVEGALSPAKPDATIITNRVTPTQYAAHRAQAERIRDGGTPAGGAAHAGVGEAVVRAAFFQGHVEYIGLARTGAQAPGLPAAGAKPGTRIPGGITGLDDLARRSAVPRATIERDNPGITDTLPATAVLAGCREHWVVAGETRANIAAQHGVSEADLVRANPDIAMSAATSGWGALPVGQKLLIPAH